jgi:hypothetical protein
MRAASGRAASGKPFGKHRHDLCVLLAAQRPVRPGAREARMQLVFAPVAARHLGNDLLGEHVERLDRNMQAIELAATHASSSAAASTRSSRESGNSRPLGSPPTACPDRPTRCSSAAIERGEPSWQTRSTKPMSIPSSSDDVQTSAFRSPRFRPLLGVEPVFARHAAVMRSNRGLAEPVGEMARHPFGEPPSIDEDERRAVLLDELREPVVDLAPDLLRHHRLERRVGHFERDVALPDVAGVDDRAFAADADEIAPHSLDRLLGRRETDPHQRPRRERIEALERKCKVRAALVRRDRVDLVDDHAARGGEHAPPRVARQQQVERFGCRYENVRRALAHRRALGLRRVAGAHLGADLDLGRPSAFSSSRIPASGRSRLRWMSFESAFSGET